MPRTLIIVSLAVLCLLASTTRAQPFLDRVPSDALVYVGWEGMDSLKTKGYEGSHLKALVEQSNLRELFEEFLPALVQRAGEEKPQAREKLAIMQSLLSALGRHRSAIYIGPLEMSGGPPRPEFAVFCDAGDEAKALAEKLNAASLKQPGRPRVTASASEGVFILSTAPDAFAKPQAMLQNDPAYQSAMKELHRDRAVAAGYVNVERVLDLVDQVAHESRNPRAARQWPLIREGFGLTGIKRIAWAGGFDGKDWAAEAYMEAPAPRHGIAAIMEGAAVGDDVLRAVPRSATMVCAGSTDIAKMLTELRADLGKIDQNAQQKFDQAMGGATLMVGTNIQTELIDALGDQWVAYSSPEVGGNEMGGLVLVNKLKDPDKAARSLEMVEIAINNIAAGRARGQHDPKIRFQQTTMDGLTIHYLATPLASPAWAVKDGNLYAALYPQVVVTASRMGTGKSSILENENFIATRKRLGAASSSSISFVDLPATAPQMYGSMLASSRLLFGLGDLIGVKSPAMIIPPLDRLTPELTPAGSAAWADAKGFHYRCVGPFPAAKALATLGQAGIAQEAMILSLVLPAVRKAQAHAQAQAQAAAAGSRPQGRNPPG